MASWSPDRRGFGAGLIAASLSAPAALGARAARGQEIDLGRGASRVPFHTPPAAEGAYKPPTDLKTIVDIYKRMTGPVRIDGTGPYPFVVDTGANQSVVSDELAAKLGLKVGRSAGAERRRRRRDDADRDRDFAVRRPHLAWRDASVLPGASIGAPGMLGLDQLEGARLTLDFRHELVTIDEGGPELPGGGELSHARASPRRPADPGRRQPRRHPGDRLPQLRRAGHHRQHGAAPSSPSPATRWSPIQQVPIISVTGQTISAEFADLPSLRIGGVTLPNWPVAFADLHIFRMWDLTTTPAILIGVDVMSRFDTVCLDFRRDEVAFRLPSDRT